MERNDSNMPTEKHTTKPMTRYLRDKLGRHPLSAVKPTAAEVALPAKFEPSSPDPNRDLKSIAYGSNSKRDNNNKFVNAAINL